MATINSNNFSITVNRAVVEQTPRTTQVNIYKGKDLLEAVSTTPGAGQYKVTITKTTNCTAQLGADNKTITLLSATSNSGQIEIAVNVENKKTYNKIISVSKITSSEVIKNSMTQYEQLSDKFTWIVKSGTSSSNMQLTDKVFDLVSNNITLTADHINLNGYVSNDGSNWSITTDGNIEAKNLSVENELSTDVLNVNVINSPNYPVGLSGDINIYVNSTTGNDDYTLDEVLRSYDEAEAQNSADVIKKFRSLRGVTKVLPVNLNGKTVSIYVETDDNGQALFNNFTSGRILIFLCSHEIKGYIGSYNCYADFKIYGGSDTSKPTTYGVIRPSTNTTYDTDKCAVFFQKSPVCGIYYCNVYGASTSSGYHAVKVTEDCKCRIDNCRFYAAYCFVTASGLSDVYVNTTSGMAADYAFKSYTGATIHLANTAQANGQKGNAYWSNGSVIFGSLSQTIVGNYNITWDSNSALVTNPTVTPATGTDTTTYKSTLGDTYRSSVYNSWKKDGTCRQGDWGYGDCTGVWFFGTQFAELKGKTITKVTITITRQSSNNGNNAAVEHKLYMHNHSTRPSGAPTLNSAWSTTFTLTRGQSRTITITNATVLNAIKNGTCKGFAIRHSYDNAHYSVCSGSATVKITYQE